jgi:uncharacterized phage protein gp47/JayE
VRQPSIDYTNLGYDSLREAMLALARENLPEWTDFSESDLGVLLIELFAYACDITLYYQTRIAANLFPDTAEEPEALAQLLRLIGYELHPPAPAIANLRLAFDATVPTPIDIPPGTQFSVSLPTGTQLTFETERVLQIQEAQLTPPDAANLRYFFPVPVVEGQTVTDEPIGFSDGSPNQLYALRQKPVIASAIRVTVNEPGGATRWQTVETLAHSSPADRHFMVQRDATGAATLLFGDGGNGLIPPRGTPTTPVTIAATYRVGGGPQGNIPANSSLRAALPLIRQATNPQAAAGGTPAEDVERTRFFAPRLYRTQERAVTLQDYRDLALQVPGVGKARAVAAGWNQVVLFIAPSGQVAEPSELLQRDLLAFFESRRMATTTVKIVAPQPADIYLEARVRANPYVRKADVEQAVEQAVAGYLAFDAVEFGQPIYLSKIYDVIQSLPQVASLLVTRFSRSPSGGVDAEGTIALGPHELPRPGYRDNPSTPPDPTNPGYRPSIVALVEGGVASRGL